MLGRRWWRTPHRPSCSQRGKQGVSRDCAWVCAQSVLPSIGFVVPVWTMCVCVPTDPQVGATGRSPSLQWLLLLQLLQFVVESNLWKVFLHLNCNSGKRQSQNPITVLCRTKGLQWLGPSLKVPRHKSPDLVYHYYLNVPFLFLFPVADACHVHLKTCPSSMWLVRNLLSTINTGTKGVGALTLATVNVGGLL